MTPDYRLLVDGKDLTEVFRQMATQIRLTDKSGVEADEINITIPDPLQDIEAPRHGVTIELFMGWKGQGLTNMGSYTVTDDGANGNPDSIWFSGHSADLRGTIKEQRDESYHDTTLGAVLQTVADRNGLEAAIDPTLAAVRVPHIDQTTESDGHFLTRLGKDHDAIASVKGGRLTFVPSATGTSGSGERLAELTIDRSQTTANYSYKNQDREGSFTGVEAKWRKYGDAENGSIVEGSTDTLKKLKKMYPSEEEAQAAARAAMGKVNRGQKEISFTLVLGDPTLFAGSPLRLTGWRSAITQEAWFVKEVSHTMGNDGYISQVKAELAASQSENG